jgi:hypothetical protein
MGFDEVIRVAADADDRAVLALLIGHVRYRDSYAAPEFKDAETIHGPYWLNVISPDVFSGVGCRCRSVDPHLGRLHRAVNRG